jgi:hypothetical protein
MRYHWGIVVTFVVKSVHEVDLRGFVVSTEKEKILGVFDFVEKKKGDRVDRLGTAIDVISKKKIIRDTRISTTLENTKEIIELTMSVTTDYKRRNKFEENWL